MKRCLALIAVLALTACGGGGVSGGAAGTTQVTINLAPQQVAANDVTLPYQFARVESTRDKLIQMVLSQLISDAHAVLLSASNTGLSYVALHITGTGVTSASINADYNSNRFTLDVDNENAIRVEETEVSLNVPNNVALTFIVEAFNADGFQLFRGVSSLSVGALEQADVALSVPMAVDIDTAIEQTVMDNPSVPCVDTDGDSFCDYYEDLFLNPVTGLPDIDNDGFPNSNDQDADGDGVSDYLDGRDATTDGYPRFVMIPGRVSGTVSVPTSQSVDIAVADLTIVNADENAVFTVVSVGEPENGNSYLANGVITYVAPASGASDSFLVTIADLNGAQVSGLVQVTVAANVTAPVFDNLPLTAVIVEAIGVATPLTLDSPTATDDSSAVSISSDAPAAFPVGNTTVTWTASDAEGNSATTTQVVSMVDNLPPIFDNLPLSAVIEEASAVNTSLTLTPPTASDIFTLTVTSNAPASFPLGNTTVTWTATDANGNYSTITQLVTLQDTTDPVFTEVLPLDDIIEEATGPDTPLVLTPPAATDAFVVTVTSNAPTDFPLGDTTVIWTATDANTHSSIKAQLVTLVDTIPPVILAFSDISIEAQDVKTYVDLSAVYADDDVDTGVVAETTDIPLNSEFPLGLTTVTWMATDASGNETTETQEVMVGSLGLCQEDISTGDYLLAADQCRAALSRINYGPNVGQPVVDNERDMANFMYAFSRVMAVDSNVGVLTGNPLTNIADLLNGFGCSADAPLHETNSSMTCVSDTGGSSPNVYPVGSPTASDVQDFLTNTLKPELVGAVANLDAISTSFNMSWTSLRNPNNTHTDVNLESDYGDVLFLRSSMNAGLANLLMSILAHDMAAADIDDLHNNPITTQAFLAAYPSALTRLPGYENSMMRDYFIAAMNDSKAAALAIQGESDDQANDLIIMDALEIAHAITTADDLLACLGAVCISNDNDLNDPSDDDKLDLTKLDSVDIRADVLPAFAGDNMTGFLPGNSDLGGLLVQLEGQAPADVLDRDRDNNSTADIFQSNLYEVFGTDRNDISSLTEGEYIVIAADPEANGFTSLGVAESTNTTTVFSGAYKHYLIKVVDNGGYIGDMEAIFDVLEYSCSIALSNCYVDPFVGVIWGQYFDWSSSLMSSVVDALNPNSPAGGSLWAGMGDFLLIDAYADENGSGSVVNGIQLTTQASNW
ncbi:MAG: HYR domain-containing protein [Gammaproteobacteria bacterium]|nr:HYR domain-containing protein [Gammaproteobacteria bacterium]